MAEKTETAADERDVVKTDEKPAASTEDGKAEQAGGETLQGLKDLKVVVARKGGIVTIGVQRPESDPHIESFEYRELEGVIEEILPVVDRAMARWDDAPMNPAYKRPSSVGRQQTAAAGSDDEPKSLEQPTLF